MPTGSRDRIVWVDCEMTGLSLQSDALIEIACVVTDSELVEVDEGVDIVIAPPPGALDGMDDVVAKMHEASGLLAALGDGVDMATATSRVLEYVKSHVPEPRKAPLAGSSVYVDRGFLARDLPEFDAYLHYRLIDVSSIKELARRWYPKAYFSAPLKHGGHRALADIRESIAELRYYREAVLVPAPGPDSAAAQTIAVRHVVAPEQSS